MERVVLQVASPLLTTWLPQPEIVEPLAVNATVPVLTVPPELVTVAVYVMELAVDAGLATLEMTVVVVEAATVELKVNVSDQLEMDTGSDSPLGSSVRM